MKSQTLIGGSTVFVCASLLVFFVVAPLSANSLLKPGDATVVAQGKEIYREHCASCHGANLEGEPNWRTPKETGRLPAPPHNEKGHTWHHTDQILFELTKVGLKRYAGEDYESDMPAYDGVLSDADIVAVLSYIKSTWPKDIREYHDHLNAKATN